MVRCCKVTANGEFPGATVVADESNPKQVELAIELTTLDPVPWVEVIHNGRIVKRIGGWTEAQRRQKAMISLDGPGWFLVRAIADVQSTFPIRIDRPLVC